MASGKFQPALNFRMLPAKLTAPFHLSSPHRFGTVARPSPSSPEPEYSMEQGAHTGQAPCYSERRLCASCSAPFPSLGFRGCPARIIIAHLHR